MGLLTASRDPAWIGCVDFGTALSKAAMVRVKPRKEVGVDDIVPLHIGKRAAFPSPNPLLLPSVVFIDDKTIVFGREAEEAALRGERRGRHAFRSPKQYLSTHDLDELDEPLPSDVDPTGKYTPRIVLTLFLAHLLERAGADARASGAPWPVRLRIARPAWEGDRGARGEDELKDIMRHAFAVVDALGARLSAEGGLEHNRALKAVAKARRAKPPADAALFELDAAGKASVLEATAVAAGAIRDTGRRVVAVADIGGGTSDFGAFMTGLRGRNVLAEIEGGSDVLRQAGDHLDMLLTRFVLNDLGLEPDDPAGRGAANRIRRRQREYKEILFKEGQVFIDAGDEDSVVTVDDFLADPQVAQFAAALRKRFDVTLKVAVACARAHSPRGGAQTPVEVLLTGGGHQLPMARALYERPSRPWRYSAPEPDFAERPEDLDFQVARRQLVVAVGGAMRDLPALTAPVQVAA